MSQDPILAELVRRVTNLEDDLMRQTARISVPVSGAFFSAYANATTTLNAGVMTTVALGATTYTDGNFNTSTSTYTCPVAGHYLFIGSVEISPSVAGYFVVTINNGGVVQAHSQDIVVASSAGYAQQVGKVFACAAGDLITMTASTGATNVAISGAQYTFLVGQIQ